MCLQVSSVVQLIYITIELEAVNLKSRVSLLHLISTLLYPEI